MSDLDAIREAISSEIRACETKIRALLEDAKDLSEREVIAAVTRIEEIRTESEESVRALDAVAARLGTSTEGGNGTLEAAVRDQARGVSEFAQRLNAGIHEQRASTEGILELGRKIGAFVMTIERLSQELRILTLNARLEAARWGQKGAAFAAVATNMSELTGEVHRANEQIGDLASSLSQMTRRVANNQESMEALAHDVATSMEAQTQALLQAYGEASGASVRALGDGVARARKILAISDGMLTNMQFQDRAAQIFEEVASVVSHTETTMNDFLGSISSGVGVREAQQAMQRARDKAGSSAVRISGESELASSDRTMQAGVVELF